MGPRNVSRIGVALIGAIGDVILSTPLVEAVRAAYPSARLTYMVGRKAAPALCHLPFIDELVYIQEVPATNRMAGFKVFQDISKRKFDLSICLTRSDKLNFAFWAAGVPRRVGFTPLRTAFTLTDVIDSDAEPQTSAHRTEYFLAAATVLNIPHPDPVRLHYRILDEERKDAREQLRNRGVRLESETLIAIHPGTSPVMTEKRRWAAERFLEVARYMVGKGRRVVLLGGPDETDVCQAMSSALGNNAIDLSGQLNFRELAAILENCRLLIHNDSSPLHLAGAVGVPVVAIFGYQDPGLWGPITPASRVVRLNLPCSPCALDFVCDRSFECIRQLPASNVIEAAEELLEMYPLARTAQ